MIICKLRDILSERGMSRRELARQSGININTVCTLANDRHHMIDLRTLDRVCTALRITPGELLVWQAEREA